ncbi:Xaa-Pro peptidase family protein [Lichenifustis flavocetrariae]|uniref:Xaa-Pro peptidase family protein n=1 Tax=Lichenifustis flavocetrariae TaxID=2949735 RepID=A0AA41Z5S1_9HYPH|nr:Xaa-Pro peptidase family protein [Lichenifustis flavocetrariae]MCW6510840.1 Xaa-Pro peptidase family protein [Lichenifustis flavocetrariae]
MSFVDRHRTRLTLQQAGLDALVIAEPEGFRTISGVSQGVAALFRRAGAGFAVLPADPTIPIGIVIGDLAIEGARKIIPDTRAHPLWIEHAVLGAGEGPIAPRVAASWRSAGRPTDFGRPATFDLRLALAALTDVLADRGLARARLGFDFDYIAASDAEAIRAAFSDAVLVNGSAAFDRLRMVKTTPEIERLTLALELSEAGLRRLAESTLEGHGVEDLHDLFRLGIEEAAAGRGLPAPPSWDYISIGPEPWGAGGRVTHGAIIKADVGCVVDGYSSDTSRNYVFGAPTREQMEFHGILEHAFDAGMEAIRPGVPLKAAHHAATAALASAGLAGYSRGHFGHGLGHSLFSEQWPFIAADTEVLFEPGMVMAFEVPIYVRGLGGFNLEDQFIIEASGPRIMTTLPRTLQSIGR